MAESRTSEEWKPDDEITAVRLEMMRKLAEAAQLSAIGENVRLYRTEQGGTSIAVDATPSVPRNGLFVVDVEQTGGSAGNASTQCSFTYTVTIAETGEVLGTGMTPQKQRPLVGKMTAGLLGSGYYSGGTFYLYEVDEVPTKVACP